MANIDKAILLYRLMAERLEKSGIAPNQAKVYREMVDFMGDCSTAEEASKKIKNSPYFLAPSVALVKDKLEILRDASIKNEMPKVAEVYQDKLKQIEDDQASIYETGYERTAQNNKIKYVEQLEFFSKIYDCYMVLNCCNSSDSEKIQDTCKDLKEAISKVEGSGASFTELSKQKKLREFVLANDEGYEVFCKEVLTLADNGPDFTAEKERIQSEATAAWELAKQQQEEICKIGKENLQSLKLARTIVVSPSDKNGSYQYIDEEVI